LSVPMVCTISAHLFKPYWLKIAIANFSEITNTEEKQYLYWLNKRDACIALICVPLLITFCAAF
ncbi:MAG: hypothetical protein ACPG35_05195, partial [Candidatus Puniceispirillaceae bacterium]